MTEYRTQSGDMTDAICHRYYGSQLGAVELVYEANRSLAELGPVLPSGLIIELPEMPAAVTAKTVRLWD